MTEFTDNAVLHLEHLNPSWMFEHYTKQNKTKQQQHQQQNNA